MDVDIVAALIGAGAAILGSLVTYIAVREKQVRESSDLENRLLKEHDLLKERMENEQTLLFDRFRKEKMETFRVEYYKKQLEAYQTFWALFISSSYYSTEEDTILVTRDGGKYLNCQVLDQFFLDFRKLFYSKLGLFISRGMREKFFEVRDFILNIQESGEPQADGMMKISNTNAKKIENGLDWIRKYIRLDVGLEDTHFPADELSEQDE